MDYLEYMRQRSSIPKIQGHMSLEDRDAMRWAVAEIERLRALVPQWQPFETAPKDRTPILAWREDAGVFLCELLLSEDGEDFVWFANCGREDLTGDLPTLWMPLPAPPEALASAREEKP